jgi:mannan endo-1,4-beta-mannosidase
MVDYNHLANPNANADARKVLKWLAGLREDKRVVCGQHICCGWDLATAYATYVTALSTEPRNYPALLGADLVYGVWSDPGQNSTLIEHWNSGGLITLSWHAYNPWTGNGLEWTGGKSGDKNIGDLADLYTPGNDAYDMWHADMDRKAEWLDELQKAGVVVLWRPFHEMNGCWTWWACRDQTKFINLWRDMFDYFTDDKGLNNLLWVYAPSRGPVTYAAEYYYPGDDYVDIVGLDYYLYENTLEPIHERGWPELKALGKPMALTEFGPSGWSCGVGNPELEPPPNCYDYGSLMDEIEAHCPEAVYFLPWWMNWAIVNQNNAQGLVNDSRVITRGAVDWRSGLTPNDIIIGGPQPVDIGSQPQTESDLIPNEIIIDDTDAGFSTSFSQDAWQKHTQDGGQHYGNSHYYNREIGSGQDTATWSFTVPEPGNYDVYAWWWEGDWRPSDVPYTVNHFYGSTTVRKDQQADGGQWNLLGTFYWHDEGSVVVSDHVSSGRDIVADAIRLVYRSEGEKKTLQEELVALRAKLGALNVVDVTAMVVHVNNALARLEELEVAKEKTLGIE